MSKKTQKKKNNKKGFEVFLREDNKVAYRVHGDMKLDEALDLFNTMIYNILEAYDKQTDGKYKDELYDRCVQGFSMTMDKFRPEKKFFHNELTNEAIMEKEDEILKEYTHSTKTKSDAQDVAVEQDLH